MNILEEESLKSAHGSSRTVMTSRDWILDPGAPLCWSRGSEMGHGPGPGPDSLDSLFPYPDVIL